MTDSDACYILFQKEQNAWILMSYVPDKAKVKVFLFCFGFGFVFSVDL